MILQRVAMKGVYCGTSYELRLEELKESSELIVNTVIAHASRASDTQIQTAGQSRSWCAFFSPCCTPRRRKLSDLELADMKGESLIRSSEQREGQKDEEGVRSPSLTNG